MEASIDYISEREKFKVSKEGDGDQLCGTTAIACAVGPNGMIGYPFGPESKPVLFVPRRGHPVIFWSTKLDAGWLRTSNVKDAYFDTEKKEWTITTKNSVYKARLVQ